MATATPARFRIPVRDPRLEELLLWRDPKRSGIAFGTITAAFLVLQFAKFNTIQWAAYLLAAVVLGCFVWNNFGKFFNKPQVPVPRLLREGVSEAQARATAEKATVYINKGLAFANRLAMGREPGLTGAVVGALYGLGRLAGTLSLLGLAYTAVLAAFTLPKVYELKHEEIDAAIDKARSQFTAFYDKHLSKVVNRIPRHTPAKPAYSTSERKEE